MIQELLSAWGSAPNLDSILHANFVSSLVQDWTQYWEYFQKIDPAQVKQLASSKIWLTTLVCFFAGILTSLTPCVYPMIPITINIFGRASQKHKSSKSGFNFHTFLLALVYVAGMSVTYSCMGLMAGLTGSLFGNILQSPYMLGFLTLLFFTLSIGQLGVFKMTLPSSLQTRLSAIGNAESIPGIFMMGLLSGLIVSPCVGPVIAGILAFVFDSSNAFRGLLYFFSFSLGLGLLFLLIGGFSGVLSSLPRSGNWMIRINRILALLMLVAALYYGSLFSRSMGFSGQPSSFSASQLDWLSNDVKAFQLAKESGRPIFVDFTADWCQACHEIERDVFSNSQVQEQLKKRFVLLRFDVTDTNEKNDLTLDKFGVRSLPTLLFVTPSGQILEKPRVFGALTAQEFLEVINTIQ